MFEVFFSEKAQLQFEEWLLKDTRIAVKISSIVSNIENTPFQGIGKPEKLKHQYSGTWSRRITQEHRLIYRVEGQIITILQCSGHYE